jgi:hypothetical protein
MTRIPATNYSVSERKSKTAQVADELAYARRLTKMGVPIIVGRTDEDGNPDREDHRWKGWQKFTVKGNPARLRSYQSGDSLGAVCGVVFDVLDIDPRNGGADSFRRMAADLGEDGPEIYWRVDTPSKGKHLYVAKLGIGKHTGWMPGLDLQGGRPDGSGRGFVFIPPTVRPSKADGRSRAYRANVDPLAVNGNGGLVGPFREYLERALEAGSGHGGTGGREEPRVLRQACIEAEAGGQRGALLKYVHELERRGLERDEVLVLLRSLASEMPVYDPRRPWYPARGNPDQELLTLFHRPGKVIPDAAPGELDGIDGPGRSSSRNLLAGVRSGDWLNKQKFAPLQFAVPKLLPAGLVVIAGAPFAGKGLLVLRFVLECARGGEVFGQACEQRDSFYLALEDGDRRMQERCRGLLGDEPIPADFQYITRTEPGRLIQTVSAWLDRHPVGIVVIDTLGKVLERPAKGETTYDRDYRILGKLTELAHGHPGCTIVVNTHTRKAKADDFVDMVSGTQAIAGAADTVLVLMRQRNSPEGTLKITSRDLDEAEYALVLERPAGWRLDGDSLREATLAADMRMTRLDDRSRSIVEFVNSSDSVSAADVAAAVGISTEDVRVYLHRLTKSGRISWLRRGVYGPVQKMRVSDGIPAGKPTRKVGK